MFAKSIVIAIFFTMSFSAQAMENRTALVIGNSSYKTSPLGNPANDARDMADALRLMNFDVIERIDVNRERIRYALREFSQKLKRKGGVGFFYFAGHGVQVDGANYLLPVNIEAENEDDITDNGINANSVIRAMEAAHNSINIVVLDACRNNPFTRSFRSATRGLRRIEGPSGSFIAYATAPGSVAADGNGKNGIYTKHLLEAMMEPGVPIENVFKKVRIAVEQATKGNQVPWESSSLKGDFYFINKVIIKSDPETMAQAALWEQLKNSEIVKDYEDFIEAYPESMYVPAAKLRIKQLTRPKHIAKANVPKEVTADPVDPIISKAYNLLYRETLTRESLKQIIALYREAVAISPNTPKVFTFKKAVLDGFVQAANSAQINKFADLQQIIDLHDQASRLSPHSGEVLAIRKIAVEAYISFVANAVDNKDYENAIDVALQGLGFEGDNDRLKTLVSDAYLGIAENLHADGNTAEALDKVNKGLEYSARNVRLQSYKAKLEEVLEAKDRTKRFIPVM